MRYRKHCPDIELHVGCSVIIEEKKREDIRQVECNIAPPLNPSRPLAQETPKLFSVPQCHSDVVQQGNNNTGLF